MNKLIVLFLAVVFTGFFTSCEKNLDNQDLLIDEIALSSNKVEVDPQDLSATIQEYVNENYFETFIEQAFSVKGKGYELDLADGEEIYFTEDGEELEGEFRHGKCGGKKKRGGRGHKDGDKKEGKDKGDLLATEDIPATITEYITANYPDAEIKGAKLKAEDDGEFYFVGLSDHVVLKFDSTGSFIEEATFIRDCDKGITEVAVEDLPEAISTYLAENYPNAEVVKAGQKDESGEYRIGLKNEETKVVLGFDADGNLIFTRECGK